MLLQALRHSFLLALTYTVISVTASPLPSADCGDDSPTRIRRGYLDTLPIAALPAATPLFVAPLPPALLPIEKVADLIGATNTLTNIDITPASSSLLAFAGPGILNGAGAAVGGVTNGVLGLLGGLTPAAARPSPPANITCLDGKYDDLAINSLFFYGGPKTIVSLCPSSTILIKNPIQFTAQGQVLTTLGSPSSTTRATLVVSSLTQTCAVYGVCTDCAGIQLRNVQVNGNRDSLGRANDGLALIEFGGNANNVVIDSVRVFDPRGWSALHIIEGFQGSCTGATVTNNQVGPSGHSPSLASGAQFRKRDNDGEYSPGQWADGISLSCRNAVVSGNTIIDATDGALVIFGSPGSRITGNTIIAENRQLLGGINAVDFYPTFGSFENTVVSGNRIESRSAMIKVGIAIGVLSWQDDRNVNTTNSRTFGGSFENNVFSSGPTGYFGYGITLAGHSSATVVGNKVENANFGGVATPACTRAMPPPGPFVVNPYTTPSSKLQKEFSSALFDFMICTGPGAITAVGVNI